MFDDIFADQVDKGILNLPEYPEISTIDSFQGREKEAVIFSCVRSNRDGSVGFLSDERRINVAFSRAKKFLCVVGDSRTLSKIKFFDEFIQQIK